MQGAVLNTETRNHDLYFPRVHILCCRGIRHIRSQADLSKECEKSYHRDTLTCCKNVWSILTRYLERLLVESKTFIEFKNKLYFGNLCF